MKSNAWDFSKRTGSFRRRAVADQLVGTWICDHLAVFPLHVGFFRSCIQRFSGTSGSHLPMLRNGAQRVAVLSRLLADQLSRPSACPSHLHTSASCADALAASEAWNFSPRDACLAGTRGVVRLGGNDVIHFLQGLVTNDVAALATPEAKPLYACILNAQGRVLHDMFLYKQTGSDTALLADVDASSMPDLIKLLKRYKLRAAVNIDDVSSEQQVWVRFGAQPQRQLAPSGQLAGEWVADPRLPELGQRAVLPGATPSLEGAQVIYGRQYRSWRIEHGVAEGNEMPAGDAIPMEYNLDGLHGVSFTKGCYVGQELVARTHFRGVVRKRLMPVVLRPQAGTAVGASIEAAGSTSKRPVGVVRVINQGSGRGLAVLRLQEGLQAARGEAKLHVQDTPQVSVAPWRPAWWPNAWQQVD